MRPAHLACTHAAPFRSMSLSIPFICALAAALTACGGDEDTKSSGNPVPDAAVTDTVSEDATSADTGPIDSGSSDAGPPDAGQPDAGESDAGSVDTGPPPVVCGSAKGDLPADLVELTWDDGGKSGQSSVADHPEWGLLDGTVQISATKMWEGVRFDLPHPAKIHGVRITYLKLPTDPDAAVQIGLFPDFGYNGFDFWQFDPIWQGDLCAGELKEKQAATWVLAKPVTVDHPGLIYVAHQRQDADSPSWAFDLSPGGLDGCTDLNKCCEKFGNCHSVWNFPDIKQVVSGGAATPFWNGLSMSRPYDYRVTLLVEYTDNVKPEDTFFQLIDGAPNTTNRQSWGDYDGDGWDDVFVNGVKLYRNVTGTLVDVTEASGLKAMGIPGSGGVWGDFDNDGCLDLFVFTESYSTADYLLRNNCDGTFANVTEKSMINDMQSYNTCTNIKEHVHSPTPGAAWVDIDADGLLDLYLSNFLCWDKATHYIDHVWHNLGDGVFESWTGKNGFYGFKNHPKYTFAGRGVNPIDYDRDGDMDILVNNYRLHPNLFYRNLGGGKVEPAGESTGLAGKPFTSGGPKDAYGHSIGTAWGDLDNDGDFDVIVANLAHPRFFNFSNKTEVRLNDGKGQMIDKQGDWSKPMGAAGLRYQETHSVPVLGDFNQDGNLDLAISCVYDGRPTDFYWGKGDGTFTLDAYHAGLTVTNGWGLATVDLDHDGDLDLSYSGKIFRNTLAADKKGHWLQVRAQGGGKVNRAAIGATIEIKAGDKTWIRHVDGGGGQGCQNSQTVHFGLSDKTQVDSVEITWPGATKTTFKGPFAADQRLWLSQSGQVHKGWAPPKN